MNSKKSNLNVEDDTLAAQQLETIECKKIMETLKKSQETYRNLFNNSEVGMFRTKLDGSELLNVNEKCLEIFGWDREEIIGKPSVIHWVDPLHRKEIVRKLKVKKRVVDFECKLFNKKGEVRTYLTSMNLYTKEGVLDGSIIDITDRKLAEEALKESEEKYRNLIVTTSEGFWLLDPDKKTIDVNQSICDMLGYSRIEMIGNTPFDFVNDENLKIFKEQTSQITSTLHRTFEIILRKKNGTNLHTIFNATSLIDKKGKPAGSFALVTDITERKLAEEEIKENEDRYRQIYQFSPDSIIIHDMDMNILDANNKAVEELGYSKVELLKKKMFELHPETEQKHSAQVLAVMKKKDMLNVETKFMRKDGSVFLAEATPCKYMLGSKPIIHVVIRDITERKQAEKSLRIAHEDLRNLTRYMDTKIEEERKTLSRDIHDGLGQLFTTMKFSISSLTKGNEINEAFVREINDIIAMTKEGIELTRNICRNLRPSLLDNLGLKEAVIEYSTNFSKLTNILCHCNFQPENFIIDKKLSLNFFRIVTELCTNVARHSKADHIMLDFSLFENELIMRLEDNGIGITTEQILSSRSLGFIGIKERLRPWNGIFSIESSQDKGSQIMIIIRRSGIHIAETNKE